MPWRHRRLRTPPWSWRWGPCRCEHSLPWPCRNPCYRRQRRSYPIDLERVASGPGRLDRVADDGNAKRQWNHLGHALDLCDVAQVEDFDLGALDRGLQHRGVDHVRNLHVDSILGSSVHLQRNVDTADVFAADQLELRRFLQISRSDIRQLGGNAGELGDVTVGDAATRLRVDDEALVRR